MSFNFPQPIIIPSEPNTIHSFVAYTPRKSVLLPSSKAANNETIQIFIYDDVFLHCQFLFNTLFYDPHKKIKEQSHTSHHKLLIFKAWSQIQGNYTVFTKFIIDACL
jgi:hypothetical protein